MPWPSLLPSSTKASTTNDRASSSNPTKTDPVTTSRRSSPESITWATASSAEATRNVFTDPQTVAAALILTGGILSSRRFYISYLRRIPEAINIKANWLGKRSIFGRVTGVGDGDNFRLYHTPGGRLSGWGWLPGRTVPKGREGLKGQTIHVRLAGIDAPELSHFGKPAQPYGQEALDWLTSYLKNRRVRAYVLKADQYQRVVATTYVWKGLWRRDVGLQMLKAGLATVYEARTGAVFGPGLEAKYRNAEWWAKTRRKGMWAKKNAKDFESPREFKTKHGVGATMEDVEAGKR